MLRRDTDIGIHVVVLYQNTSTYCHNFFTTWSPFYVYEYQTSSQNSDEVHPCEGRLPRPTVMNWVQVQVGYEMSQFSL